MNKIGMTKQIGKTLERTFGEGKNMWKVSTESLGQGLTLTKAVNAEGKEITRLKRIGNKVPFNDVYTRRIVKDINVSGSNIVDRIETNRIYDASGKHIKTTLWKGFHICPLSPKDFFQRIIKNLLNIKAG